VVLGELDNQRFVEQTDRFSKYCTNTKAVRLNRQEFEVFKEFDGWFVNQKGIIMPRALGCARLESPLFYLKEHFDGDAVDMVNFEPGMADFRR